MRVPTGPARRSTIMSTDALTITHALVEAATTGGYAPSIQDTQPWRWRIAGKTLDLYSQRHRGLDATDLDTRLATLSCGAALHHARVSLAAQNWHPVITRMPDPTDRTYLAQLRVDERAPVEPEAIQRLRTITVRHTDRRPVSGSRPTADALSAVAASVEAEETALQFLDPDQVRTLTRAADLARQAGAEDAPWHAELAYWTDLTQGDRDAVAFAVLSGRTDRPAAWLRAGEALSAGWLTATEQGLTVLPLSAPVEVDGTRETLHAMITDGGHPYLVLRLGTADPALPGPPQAPRLPSRQSIERS